MTMVGPESNDALTGAITGALTGAPTRGMPHCFQMMDRLGRAEEPSHDTNSTGPE